MATVATAEGLRLHLSTQRGRCGQYKGVYEYGGAYRAQYKLNGRVVYIGRNYATAVEAAVAYARTVGEYEPSTPTVATEAEGLRLHVSPRRSTGYKGVIKQASGRFRVKTPAGIHLGYCDTAVEAAVVYARAVAAADAAQARAVAAADAAPAAQPVEAPQKRMRVASRRAAEAAAQAKAEAAAAQERAADRTRQQQARTTPASTAGTGVKLEVPHPTRSAARSQGGASGGAATSVRGTPASASVKWEAPDDQPCGKWQRGAPLVAPPPAPVTAPTGPPRKWEAPDDQPSGKWQRGAPPAATATNLEVFSGGEGEDDEVEVTGGCSRSEKDAAGWANAIELDGVS